MILSPVILALLPLVTAKVHKLKLQKIPPTASNPDLETAYLAEKYGAPAQVQFPLMGAGGSGRRVERPSTDNLGEPLFWTQEQLKGGHGVPLTSMSLLHSFRPKKTWSLNNTLKTS